MPAVGQAGPKDEAVTAVTLHLHILSLSSAGPKGEAVKLHLLIITPMRSQIPQQHIAVILLLLTALIRNIANEYFRVTIASVSPMNMLKYKKIYLPIYIYTDLQKSVC